MGSEIFSVFMLWYRRSLRSDLSIFNCTFRTSKNIILFEHYKMLAFP